MPWYADLHIHSKYSRATARTGDLFHLASWAQRKGLSLLGTADFTHPAWRDALRAGLEPAEPGVFRLSRDLERAVREEVPEACRGPVRFLLSVEISTIYKAGERTRKVHHVVLVPDFDAAERFVERLLRIGNLASDGRPILGLDSRDLLEIVLESGDGCYLIPAHIWTPWFSALGSKSGFDSIQECYRDLADHIFAVETGLSSDPEMNWRVSSLDRYRLISSSDAHSPGVLAREAVCFDGPVDFFSVRHALEHGEGYVGTVELFPEEGKYHADGHRKCGVVLGPTETRALDGRCPECGRPLTVGVLYRVDELSDRPEGGPPPPRAGRVESLVPLSEILSELHGVGPKTKTVARAHQGLIERLGPELPILGSVPLEEIRRAGGELVAEAIGRLREGRVRRQPGFDGEYGVIRLFEPDELARRKGGGLLAHSPAKPKRRKAAPAAPPKEELPLLKAVASAAGTDSLLAGLDADQRAAAECVRGPLLIVAGPGSGKTRTLTHRIAHLVRDCGVAASSCLAITFTRRAAEELSERLALLLPGRRDEVAVQTFHGLGLALLREEHEAAGLPVDFGVADDATRLALAQSELSVGVRLARRLIAETSVAKRTGVRPEDPEIAAAADRLAAALRARGLVDFDDLVGLPADVLEADAVLRARWRERFGWISVDEFQDVDAQQYRLVAQLAAPDANLCVIGDPDQAIYGFRGADVGLVGRFAQDRPGCRTVTLRRNYRSGRPVVEASGQVLAAADGEARDHEARPDGPEQIVSHEAPTERAEAEFVVHTIEQLLGGHSFFSVDSGRTEGQGGVDLAFSDLAVLTRTDGLADEVEEAFARSGMPFQRRAHGRLAAQPGVAALVDGVVAGAAGAPLVGALESTAAGLEGEQGADAASLRRAVELLRPLAQASGTDRDRFLAELALGAPVDTWDPRAERVSLLTLHASKGLEFRVVFIVGCEDGLLPLRCGPKEAADVAEERRLLYVGMTRARERLFLCRARRRAWRGKVRRMEPSPFLAAIEERLVEHRASQARRRAEEPAADQLELF